MKIQLVDPNATACAGRTCGRQDHAHVAALGGQTVKRFDIIDVPDEVAALLLIQTANWALPDKAPKAEQEAAAKFIADNLAELAAASQPVEPEVAPEFEPIINTEEV